MTDRKRGTPHPGRRPGFVAEMEALRKEIRAAEDRVMKRLDEVIALLRFEISLTGDLGLDFADAQDALASQKHVPRVRTPRLREASLGAPEIGTRQKRNPKSCRATA